MKTTGRSYRDSRQATGQRETGALRAALSPEEEALEALPPPSGRMGSQERGPGGGLGT